MSPMKSEGACQSRPKSVFGLVFEWVAVSCGPAQSINFVNPSADGAKRPTIRPSRVDLACIIKPLIANRGMLLGISILSVCPCSTAADCGFTRNSDSVDSGGTGPSPPGCTGSRFWHDDTGAPCGKLVDLWMSVTKTRQRILVGNMMMSTMTTMAVDLISNEVATQGENIWENR